MYEELIERLQPKPRFNLTWYDQAGDSYSEGQIEDTIIEIISRNEPEDYTQAIADCYNWSTYYHLSHIRKNILNWYPFERDSSVLEIGCGLGAITNMLCDSCRKVTSVEMSLKRATGTLLRCREKSNLEIIVGNLNDIEFEGKFDYITLIGVLEYQGSYTNSSNPYIDFLKKVKNLLKPNGKLLIAIENQYGLKYWCGAREDHTGIPFEGMNQYSFSGEKVRTFSKQSLDRLVKESGLPYTYFYYPMPDYKLPTVIYSQDILPKDGNMFNMQYYYIPDTHTMIAQEQAIYEDLIENGVFEFFANSFLVECSETSDLGKVPFASLSCRRCPEYRVGTKFTREGIVKKFLLEPIKGQKHLEQMLKNEKELEESGLRILRGTADGIELRTKFIDSETVEDRLLVLYKQEKLEEIFYIYDEIKKEIEQSSVEASWEENILYTFELGISHDKEKFGKILKKGFIDMIPRNAFYVGTNIIWFDQEWLLENVPSKFILYRAVTLLYNSYPELDKVISLTMLAQRYQLVECWKEFQTLEKLFYGAVIDQLHMAEASGFAGQCGKDLINNIKKLVG